MTDVCRYARALCVSISVPMNAAAIEFRKHVILGNRGQWRHGLRSLPAGAGVSPGTGVGVQLCVADLNYLDDLLDLSCPHSSFCFHVLHHSSNRQFKPLPPSPPDA